ncbi:LLM class flavin-dependent oxidoreductase [Streptomyces sp. NPDC051243]|uniref:LLM class flavin-dependent oxidoreductase n=1 Tax=Streptomyces sp. NPDC051243 TaxID=3365646 RepID=UPI0037A6CC90
MSRELHPSVALDGTGHRPDGSPPPGDSAGRLDAVAALARAAPLTSRIGLVPTVTTTHTDPFRTSTAPATLDHVSEGSAGWLVDVSSTEAEALAVGGRGVEPAAELRAEAADAAGVAVRLWDSWEDDAETRDAATGRFIDRDRLHHIDFEVRTSRSAARPTFPAHPRGARPSPSPSTCKRRVTEGPDVTRRRCANAACSAATTPAAPSATTSACPAPPADTTETGSRPADALHDNHRNDLASQASSPGPGRLDQAGCEVLRPSADPSGVWCVQLQGGGGSRRNGGPPCSSEVESLGESASDDNAADARARARDAGMIQTTRPSPHSPASTTPPLIRTSAKEYA